MRALVALGVAGWMVLSTSSVALASLMRVRTYDGHAAGDEFGAACVGIGDLDGDGIAEFAIGAPGDATGGADAGRVFIYSGAHPFPEDPVLAIMGQPGERLGQSLGAGDVDDDGLADLIIGCPGSLSHPETLTGRVVIVYGATPIGSRPLASIAGTTPGGRFGWSVQTGVQWSLNGSTLRLLVGAPDANTGAGEVHGLAAGDPPTDLFVLHGQAAGEAFGYSLANAGIPFGYIPGPQFLVGAPGASLNGAESGRYALFTYSSPEDTTGGGDSGSIAGARLGQSIGGGRDITPNYFEPSDDWVVGEPGAAPNGIDGAGRARFDCCWSYDGTTTGQAFGSTVGVLDDITGNRLPDVCVAQTGAVLVYTAGPGSASIPVTLAAEGPDDEFGAAISNTDETPYESFVRRSLLIGAPQYGGHGRVYVYTDPTPPTGVPMNAPEAFRLGDPAPNPSRDAVTLAIELPRATHVRLVVLDVSGREVARLANGSLGPGREAFAWRPARSVSPGLYWAVLDAPGVHLATRLIRLR